MSTANQPRVAFAGGGTAGHIQPMLAMAEALKTIQPQSHIIMIGTQEGMEAELVPAAGYQLHPIPKVPMPRTLNTDLIALPWRLRSAIKTAKLILTEQQIQVVVGVGGYAATPAYLAAKQLGIPVVIHEGNVRPGLANKLGARFAHKVATAFENTPLPKAQWVGMPLRAKITTLQRTSADQNQARLDLGIDPEKFTVVVTGGSSGAQHLNETIRDTVTDITAAGAQILHLTGRGKVVTDDSGQPLKVPGYHQREYIDGLETVYQAADLVVARSGAGTVHELATVGVPSVLVPLPIGNGEQRLNGQPLVDVGAAVMVDDADFTPQWARNHLSELIKDHSRLVYMSQAAKNLGSVHAGTEMAQMILELSQKEST